MMNDFARKRAILRIQEKKWQQEMEIINNKIERLRMRMTSQ